MGAPGSIPGTIESEVRPFGGMATVMSVYTLPTVPH